MECKEFLLDQLKLLKEEKTELDEIKQDLLNRKVTIRKLKKVAIVNEKNPFSSKMQNYQRNLMIRELTTTFNRDRLDLQKRAQAFKMNFLTLKMKTVENK